MSITYPAQVYFYTNEYTTDNKDCLTLDLRVSVVYLKNQKTSITLLSLPRMLDVINYVGK